MNHFSHKNILKFARKTRIGDDIDECNENMIHIWNSQVQPNDTVWCLGDFSFARKSNETENILRRLNGKLHLIYGNHDHWINDETSKYWETMQDYKRTKFDGVDVMMFHYPIAEWDKMHRGAFHLYGHVHGTVTLPGKALDVGIDNRPLGDMRLWEWDEIKAYMKDRSIGLHHGK